MTDVTSIDDYRKPEISKEPKFELGQIVATPGFLNKAGDATALGERGVISGILDKHARGDWGECCKEDWATNEDALENGHRLMSVYKFQDETKFWVITEWDRSVTTMLLPEEY